MADLYDDATVGAAKDALDEWLFRMHGLTSSCSHDDEAEGLLDAVAPLIAAKALRDAAADVLDTRGERKWLTARADEIERGRS